MYYKIKDIYIKQRWYTNDIFILVKSFDDRYIAAFGTDCTWKSIITGKTKNLFDTYMKRLSIEECREINTSIILNEDIL